MRGALFGHVGLLESYFDGEHRRRRRPRADVPRRLRQRPRLRSPNRLVKLRNRWHELQHSNRSLAQAKANARFHYGLGVEFYRPWLDAARHDVHLRLLEGRHEDAGRGAAQQDRPRLPQGAARARRDLRRRRLRLGRPAVPGLGGLRRARHRHQRDDRAGRASCGRRSRAAGSATRSRVVECDMREMPGQYDKLLSIGTLEHAGPDALPEVVRAHADALKPGGLGVIHFIGHVGAARHRVLHPRVHLPRRLDSQPVAGDRLHGALRARDPRRREPAPPLRADARRLGRALRPQLGGDPERSTRAASTSASAASGAPTCGPAPKCSATKTPQLDLFQVTVSKGSVAGNYPMSRSFLYAAG